MAIEYQNYSQNTNTNNMTNRINSNRYKTKLCKNYMEGHCQFEGRCNYAHGRSELRILSEEEKEVCWFFNNGTCANGNFCPYRHEYSTARKPMKLQYPCFEQHIHGNCDLSNCSLEHYPLTDEEFNFHFPQMKRPTFITITPIKSTDAGFNWSKGIPNTIKGSPETPRSFDDSNDSNDSNNNCNIRSISPDWGYKIFYKHPVDNQIAEIENQVENDTMNSNNLPEEVNILIEKIMCAAEKLKVYAKQNPEIYHNALSRLLY
jgi:hypothetical protein